MSIPKRRLYTDRSALQAGRRAGETMAGTMTTHNQVTTTRSPTDAAAGSPSPFVFVGESLALDLVNTEVVVRRTPIDLLAAPGAYAAWWRAAAERYPEVAGLLPATAAAANPELLPTVVALRRALRALFGAVADGTPLPTAALAVLNRALEAAHDAVVLGAGGEPRPLLVPDGPNADAPLAAIARSAFALLTGADLSRLHRCANEHCVLLFYDTTKSGTRRWCSTACMNRARSRARYRARKDGAVARSRSPATGSGSS
jgi:predicted RNA-binding Zn ribbon-like protein